MKNHLLALLLIATLSGCDAFGTFQHGVEQSLAVASELEKSEGIKPFVGFNWNNGTLQSVSITYPAIPNERSLQQLSDNAQAAVGRHFKQQPDQIVLAFSIRK